MIKPPPTTPHLVEPMSTHVGEDLWDPRMAASYVGLAVATLADLRCKGGGPVFMKAGRLIRYRKSSLDAWLESRSFGSTCEYGKGE